MKSDSRIEFEAAALSLQFRDVLIDIRKARQDSEKLALFDRIEKLLINACDRLRSARKNRSIRSHTNPQSETPWSRPQKVSGPQSRQTRATQFNSQEKRNNLHDQHNGNA